MTGNKSVPPLQQPESEAEADPAGGPAGTDLADTDPLVEEDALVEEVSIDGMCGVY